MYILGRRIWPPPRWPLFHEAKRIVEAGGAEALDAWLESLTPLERSEFCNQTLDILLEATKIAVASVVKDIQEGKLDL